MLLEDSKKIRAAREALRNKDKSTVTGLACTEEGIKEVDVSLSSNGLEIIEKPERSLLRKPGRPRKSRKSK